jgi:hypothetical protein
VHAVCLVRRRGRSLSRLSIQFYCSRDQIRSCIAKARGDRRAPLEPDSCPLAFITVISCLGYPHLLRPWPCCPKRSSSSSRTYLSSPPPRRHHRRSRGRAARTHRVVSRLRAFMIHARAEAAGLPCVLCWTFTQGRRRLREMLCRACLERSQLVWASH